MTVHKATNYVEDWLPGQSWFEVIDPEVLTALREDRRRWRYKTIYKARCLYGLPCASTVLVYTERKAWLQIVVQSPICNARKHIVEETERSRMLVETTVHINQHRPEILKILRCRVKWSSILITFGLCSDKSRLRRGSSTIIHLEWRLEPSNYGSHRLQLWGLRPYLLLKLVSLCLRRSNGTQQPF